MDEEATKNGKTRYGIIPGTVNDNDTTTEVFGRRTLTSSCT